MYIMQSLWAYKQNRQTGR